MNRPHRISIAVGAWLALSTPGFGSAQTPVALGDGPDGSAPAVMLPVRRVADRPPGPPPALPEGAENLRPLTLVAVIRHEPIKGRARVLRQTVTRTADRVHVSTGPGAEWLFERNEVDRRRVSAFRIEHARRTIVLYGETDLRLMLGIRGWAQVLSLGLDSEVLGGLNASGETRSVAGISFARFLSAERGQPAQEIWWSKAHLFARRIRTRHADGAVTFSIERIRMGTDPEVLRPPLQRFPGYRVQDLSDWQEGH